MTKASEVIRRAATKEAQDAIEMLADEVTQDMTGDEAHALFILARDLEQGFARIAVAAAGRAEVLLKREQMTVVSK